MWIKDPVERFWANVDRSGGPDACWPWLGPFIGAGYGIVWFGGKNETAHRAAYRIIVGPIPPGLVLDHIVCDNPPCCNPAHVTPVTMRANTKRGTKARPGFPRRPASALKAFCIRGHPLSPGENVRWYRRQKVCRGCNREAQRAWRASHPGYRHRHQECAPAPAERGATSTPRG